MRRWQPWFVGSALVLVGGFLLLLPLGAVSDDAPVALRAVSLAAGWVWVPSLLTTPVFGVLARRENKRAQTSRQAELAVVRQSGHEEGRRLTAALLAGLPLQPLAVWGVVLEEGEQAHLDFPTNYARFYGTNAAYQHVTGLFVGSAGFVAAGVAMTALGNSMRRSQARAEAVQRWREQEFLRVLVTDRRLICLVGGQWTSFYYNAVTAFHPEPENQSIVFEFSNAVPLALYGPSLPSLIAYTTHRIHGVHGLQNHPALASLR
ncbi:hypothetical protein [Actinocorallia libanotica]|uniref:Uncharacterized protein n=1 Tax=Actinocorallia libanotica TaxID=46162 RepID=A0ABP4C1M1_9ACTN